MTAPPLTEPARHRSDGRAEGTKTAGAPLNKCANTADCTRTDTRRASHLAGHRFILDYRRGGGQRKKRLKIKYLDADTHICAKVVSKSTWTDFCVLIGEKKRKTRIG